MQERIVEILIYVLNEVRRTNKPLGEIDIAPLSSKGYTEAEISTAFSWLFDRINLLAIVSREPAPASFRVLSPAEQFAISTEAYGYLLQLRELNMISATELEEVIERAMGSDVDRFGVMEIEGLVVSVLFDTRAASANVRTQLNGHDTVQ